MITRLDRILLILIIVFLVSCSTSSPHRQARLSDGQTVQKGISGRETEETLRNREDKRQQQYTAHNRSPTYRGVVEDKDISHKEDTLLETPETPELVPADETISPLKERIISISVKAVPLREVLHSIAETVSLNIVMQAGVDPELPITVSLRNVTSEKALQVVLSSTDYFYEIKGNILYIKATDTRVFEFGHPAVISTYNTGLGGDILGATPGKLRGSITLDVKSDEESSNIWLSIESTLQKILGGGQEGEATGGPASYYSIDRLAGTILVRGTKQQLEEVEEYLSRIKEALSRQVIIEARVVEVKLSEALQYGIDWDILDHLGGVGDIDISAANFTTVVDEGRPLLEFAITGSDFTALMQALQTQGDVRVLSNPRVNLLNGQTALLSVGRSTDIITKVETTITEGETTFTIETSSIMSGIIIGMVPYIDSKGNISITITPIVSDIVTIDETSLGGAGTNSIRLSLPTVDLREMSTTVKVKDGEMIVIGGLISRKESTSQKKIPLLGSLPVVGGLFRNYENIEEKTELLIMLKPVLRTI